MRLPAPEAVPDVPPRTPHPARVATGRHAAKFSPANKKLPPTVGEDGKLRYGNGRLASPKENERARIVNWNSRHQLILWMDIAGQRVVDIAPQVGMLPQSVSAIRNSPLYQQQRAELVEKLTGSTLEDIMEMLRRDAPKNLQVMIDLRDKFEMNAGDPKVVLGAAKQLSREVDRLYPRKTHHVEDRTIRISIEAAQLNRLAGALKELGHSVPAEVIELTDPNRSERDEAPLAGKSIEELLTEVRAADAARDPDEPR